RAQLVRESLGRLLRTGFEKRNPVLLDLAADMLVPPLSRLVAFCVLGLLVAVACAMHWGGFRLSLAVWGSCVAGLVYYVFRGWEVSGTGARGLLDLALAPGYMAWKVTLLFGKRAPKAGVWVRTKREAEHD